MINPSRRTVAINGASEVGQSVSGTMLSITAQTNYAALALKAAGTSGSHFFQIIDSSNVVKAVYRDDGVAIFGSTSYSNYGRALFVDDGFSGNPFAGQLSSLCYYSQDDQSIYGWAVGNRTYDTGWQKANVVCVALNAGGGYMGTPDNTPLSFRTNNVDRLTISGAGISTFAGSVDLRAGTATASTYPLKFTSGALLTTPVVGVEEFLTDKRYTTITTGTARKEYTLNDIALTSGRVSFSTTNGRQTDLAAFTYATNRLSPTYLTLAAGTAAAGTCPLVMTSGTLLTTAIAGGVEFLTDKYYGTITTGAARKEFTLNDIALTSGRVPFTTTNGRLTDAAAFTFAGSTLTVTNIAATILTGTQTYADAVNLVFNTTTGTKIGTATTQKLGFYNATPIVQGASVADATGGVVIDAEARTAINTLISRIEALGLIATV
jgi:hypothetical protein